MEKLFFYVQTELYGIIYNRGVSMNLLLVLSIASLFYISILGFFFFRKKHIESKETKIYELLIIVLIAEILLEISMRVLADRKSVV